MPFSAELACAFLVLLLAASAHAVTSFGFVLLSVPLLAILFDPHTAVVTAVLASGLVALVGWRRDRSQVDAPSVRWLTLTSLLGIPVGLFIFTSVEARLLLIVIGAITITCALLIWARVRLPSGPWSRAVAGQVSGALLTSTGTNGPPLVIVLQGRGLEPVVLRATIQAIFTLQAGVAVVGLFITDRVSWLALTLFAISIPATFVGWQLGDRLFQRLSHEGARQLVLSTLIVSGAVVVARAAS